MQERILTAYMELSSLYGLTGMTMDEVAARAGVSKRTLYRYFPSKEALMQAAINELKTRINHKINELIAANLEPEQIIAEMFTTILTNGRFVLNPRGIEDLRLRYPQVWQEIDQFRQARMQEIIGHMIGGLTLDIEPVIITTVAIAIVREVLNPDFIFKNNLVFEEAALQVSRLFLRMIGK